MRICRPVRYDHRMQTPSPSSNNPYTPSIVAQDRTRLLDTKLQRLLFRCNKRGPLFRRSGEHNHGPRGFLSLFFFTIDGSGKTDIAQRSCIAHPSSSTIPPRFCMTRCGKLSLLFADEQVPRERNTSIDSALAKLFKYS